MVSRSRVTTSDMRMGGAAALLVMLHVATSAAQPPPPPVRAYLHVDAEEACATAALAQRVRERSQRIELVEDAGDVPRLYVSIGAAGARDRVALLSVQWPDGQRSERRIKARSCEAAIDALGLLIAMTLDPAALMESVESAPSAPTTGEQAAASERAAASAGRSLPDEAPKSALAPNAREATVEKNREPAGEEHAEVEDDAEHAGSSEPFAAAHVAAGLSANVVAGPAPRAMPGFGLYARLVFHGVSLWTPAAQLRASHAWVNGLVEPGGEADFALDRAQLDICPLGVWLASLTAHACMTGEVGRLSASGSRSYAPQTHHLLWTGLGGTLLVALPLASIVELYGGFEVAAPLRRDSFSFRPDVFHEVRALSLSGHLGLGVRFP